MEINYKCYACGKSNKVDITENPSYGLGSSGIGAYEIGSPIPFADLGNIENMMGYLQNKALSRSLRFSHNCNHCDEENVIQLDV